MDEVIYTPRFIEDYVILEVNEAIKKYKVLTYEQYLQIANKFLAEHGEKYDAYLRTLGNLAKDKYGDTISTFEGMKNKFKEDFITALQKRGILPQDETDKKLWLLREYLKATQIHFTFIGGGSGGGTEKVENYVNIDWIQEYKFVEDFPERKFAYDLLAMITVFHELAHRFSIFLGTPTNKLTGGKYIDAEESFAQGVAHVIANYLNIRDDYTAYYQQKNEEIKGLKCRIGVAAVINLIYSEAKKIKLDILSRRCYNLAFIYHPADPRRIEAYSNPMEESEVRAIVITAMEKIRPA